MRINSMAARAAIGMAILLSVAAVATEPVTFDGTQFTMTCAEEATWFRGNEKVLTDKKTLTLNYSSETKGLYRCKYGGEAYYFYVKGNVCENCIQLDAFWLGCAITADMAGTIILMMVIFKWKKKKSSAGSKHASKAPALPGGRAPPVPSPDYEPLNPHTRSQDPYSIVSGMG